MGVDTRLYISKRWNVQDILDVLKLRYDVKPIIRFHDWAPDYMCVDFMEPKTGHPRTLHIHSDSEIGGFKATMMGFRSNESGRQMLITLAETFGGLFQESDCDDDFVAFKTPSEGEVDYVVKEALKKEPSLGTDTCKMGEYMVEREKK